MSVRQLANSMGSQEFVEWIAFSQIEPFGGPVEDVRAGVAAAAIYNVNRASASDDTVDPRDLFGWTEKEPVKEETADEMIARLRAMTDRNWQARNG